LPLIMSCPSTSFIANKMPRPNIAIAGATGNLGQPILSTLLSAGYPVTVLSRVGGNHAKLKPHPNLLIKEVDFTSAPNLNTALHGIDVVVSCLATLAMGSQNPLIDAAVAAGVKRFIPAEFGMDSQNPLAMQLPVCMLKVATQNYLHEKARTHPHFSWTGVASGMFLDWGIEKGILINPTNHTATLYDGGDVPFSATTLADIAKAVIGVIEKLDETENRLIYIHSALVTQNQLVGYIKDKDGKEWTVVRKETETVKQESFRELEKDDGVSVESAMLGFSITGMFDAEYGCDFSGRLDNDVMGLKRMDEAEVRKMVEQYVAS
jgi:nucleoside-diphosphate-sugar epimerase